MFGPFDPAQMRIFAVFLQVSIDIDDVLANPAEQIAEVAKFHVVTGFFQ